MLESLSGETRLYPIIGDPIIYVKAPQRLTAKFEARGHNGVCLPMQVRGGDLEGVMRGLSLIPNVDGLLITMPHKITTFAYCATSSETSKLLGVVSVTRRNPDGSRHARWPRLRCERISRAERAPASNCSRAPAAVGAMMSSNSRCRSYKAS